ncbi:hypothetical protein [Thermaerobacillus caldiproteolyticus]|uniref:hypothetical protein n=1 Tax=Thermaerobacillus caldiproteolyticus TaxID=247480 RepID=UPI0018F1ADB0|nr:hypothetical protein [Anoxybacillus caldiproteolyticus]
MNNIEFVESIVEVVRESTISDTVNDLIDPPGRKPSKEDMELSSWFNSLAEKDKEVVKKIIQNAVDTTIFGLLAVIDGVRAIKNSFEKGKLELYYKNKDVEELLNDPDKEYLHEIYNSIVTERRE